MSAIYTTGDGKSSALIQTAIDLIPGNLSVQGHQWVQVYAKASGYSGRFDSYSGFSNASAIDYIDIEAMVSHGGSRDQGIVLDMNDNSDFRGIIFALGYVRFHGFCVTRSLFKAATGNTIIGIHDPSSYMQIYDCLLYDSNADAGQSIRGFYVYDVTIVGLLIANCQIFNLGAISGTPESIRSLGQGTAGNKNVFANNVFTQSTFFANKNYLLVKNNYASSFTSLGGANCSITYNISSDATADDWGGTGNLISKAAANQFVSVTPGSEDLHIKSTSDCWRAGADMSAYFTTDCVGTTRSVWRTGAFESREVFGGQPLIRTVEGIERLRGPLTLKEISTFPTGSTLGQLGFDASDHTLKKCEVGGVWTTINAFPWFEVTETTGTMAVNTGYIANNAALVTLTLPATSAQGIRMRIAGKGAGLWKLAQNSGQTVHFGTVDSTTGTAGYLQALNKYDCIELVCITANTDFVITSSVGNIDVE